MPTDHSVMKAVKSAATALPAPVNPPPTRTVQTPKRSGATNAEFAASSSEFRKYCENAGVEPTKRQASKFRRRMGRAYRAMKKGA